MSKHVVLAVAVLVAVLALASANFLAASVMSASTVVHQPVAITRTHHHTHFTSVPYVYTAYSSPAYYWR
ncbi:hypothetical protein ONE63_000754 [Megalurothrips usitatus]|uniref:Uncharacterized protein n=1 Tax=Megalurothrips usitatus TaxID=439358 RepID=A0AAV7Y2J1_9NEOP|nr:hypothetical protein ONE63_000754 [Megalurothrips usitatus]